MVRFIAAVTLCTLGLAAADTLRQTFEAAAQALSRGDLEAAGRGFEQVLKAAPAHIGALGNLGVVYSRQGRVADAISVYERARKLAPNEPGLLLNLGLAYLKQEDQAKAKPLFAKVVALQPANGQARELLASTQVLTGEPAEAVRTLEQLPRNSGVLYFLSLAYLKLGEREKARGAMEALFTTVSPVQANYLQGKAYYESQRLEDAVAALEKARDLDGSSADIQLELAKTYVSLRRAEDAEKFLRETLRIRPSDPEAMYFLGAMLTQDGRVDEGVALLEKARAAKPGFWGAYYYLGKAKLQAGNAQDALKLLRVAADKKPDESPVFYQLARALKAAGLHEEARRATARVAELKKGDLNRIREALVSR